MISWIIVSHVEPHRRAALGNRGNRGTEGLEFFSKEKPFREVSCNFVDVFLGYMCGFVDVGGSEKRRRYFSAAPSLIFSFQFSTFNSISCVSRKEPPCLRGGADRCQLVRWRSGRSPGHVWMAR